MVAQPPWAIREDIEEESKRPGKKQYLLVTHPRPDTDAIACLWFYTRYLERQGLVKGRDFDRRFCSERPGEEETSPYEKVLCFDMGGGSFDQHELELNASSFQLVVEHLGFGKDDPTIYPILDMVNAADNAGRLSWDSIHYQMRYLSTHKDFRLPNNGGADWEKIIEFSFVLLDNMFNPAADRAARMEMFLERLDRPGSGLYTLKLGEDLLSIVVSRFCGHNFSGPAFELGHDVVVSFSRAKGAFKKDKNKFSLGIQQNNRKEGQEPVDLSFLAGELRMADARKRGVAVGSLEELATVGKKGPSGLYLHDSRSLIVLDSLKSPTKNEDEFLRLTPEETVRGVAGFFRKMLLPGDRDLDVTRLILNGVTHDRYEAPTPPEAVE